MIQSVIYPTFNRYSRSMFHNRWNPILLVTLKLFAPSWRIHLIPLHAPRPSTKQEFTSTKREEDLTLLTMRNEQLSNYLKSQAITFSLNWVVVVWEWSTAKAITTGISRSVSGNDSESSKTNSIRSFKVGKIELIDVFTPSPMAQSERGNLLYSYWQCWP